MRLLQPLFALFTSSCVRELARMVEYLKEENREHYYREAA